MHNYNDTSAADNKKNVRMFSEYLLSCYNANATSALALTLMAMAN